LRGQGEAVHSAVETVVERGSENRERRTVRWQACKPDHSRSCALPGYTTFEKATEGCTCPRGPSYFVVRRGAKTDKLPAGKNRKNVERALGRVEVELEDGANRALRNVRFRDWGAEWRAALERKETTRDSYASTIVYATEVFGGKYVRDLEPADVRAFNAYLRA
jgi:hypothetical protein